MLLSLLVSACRSVNASLQGENFANAVNVAVFSNPYVFVPQRASNTSSDFRSFMTKRDSRRRSAVELHKHHTHHFFNCVLVGTKARWVSSNQSTPKNGNFEAVNCQSFRFRSQAYRMRSHTHFSLYWPQKSTLQEVCASVAMFLGATYSI